MRTPPAAPPLRQPVKLPPPPADLAAPRRLHRVSATMWSQWTV